MARKRPGKPDPYSPLIGLVVIAALGVGGWYLWHRQPGKPSGHVDASSMPVDIAGLRIDPANEGRFVRVTGDVRMDKAAQDPQLGIRSDSAVLWRKVEMLQWRERCAADRCGYTLDWAAEHIDSTGFRESAAHANPARFPFPNQAFFGEHVRLGAFEVDSAAVPDEGAAVLHAVRPGQLPENLAATFRIDRGVLFAATNAGHPEAGDVRVTYRALPSGQQQTWSGIQKGDRLVPANR
jgi:hypothetical protein